MGEVGNVAFAFDAKNEDAQAAARKSAARRVTKVSKETKAAIRAKVVDAIRSGQPVYDAAKEIRADIGMNTQQALAAHNYRVELVNQGLSPEKVDRLYDKYVERKITERSVMIARTEVMDALNQGERDAWDQAQKDGLIPKDAMKGWMATGDEVTCETCGALDGQEVPMDGEFDVDGDGMDGPPAHVNCRCAQYVVP